MPEDIDWLLSQEGLNSYQKKAFLALLKAGSGTVSQISAASGVPESKLYEVLKSLERLGFIGSKPGRPQVFFANPLEHSLGERLKSRAAELTKASSLLELASKQYSTFQREPEEIEVLRGRENVLRQLRRSIDEAKISYLGCFPFSNLDPSVANSMRLAVKRGVELKVVGLLEPENKPNALRYLKLGVKVRGFGQVRAPPLLRFSVFDGQLVYFTITDANRDYLTIRAESKALSQSISDLFKYYWALGLEVD